MSNSPHSPRLVLLRHGEMDGDPFVRPSRPVSGCLSELGIAQATAASRHLAGRRWRAVLTSPFGRALQTAEIAYGADAPITIVDALHEWLPNPALAEAPSTTWEEMWRHNAKLTPEESWQTQAGEGTYAMYARVIPGALAALAANGWHSRNGGFILDSDGAGGDIAIVAHGGSLGVLLSHLLGMRPFPVASFGFELCGIAELVLAPQAGVWYPHLVIPAPGAPT